VCVGGGSLAVIAAICIAIFIVRKKKRTNLASIVLVVA